MWSSRKLTIEFTRLTMDGGHRIVNYTLATAADTGSITTTDVVTSSGTKPKEPTINTVTPGDQKLTIDFTRLTKDGGHRIDNYTLETATGELKSIPTGSSFDIKGLTNGKLYTYHLKAHNAMGGSAPAVITGTPGTKPKEPTINTVTPGDKKLTIEFTRLTMDGGHRIVNYTLATATGELKSIPTGSSFDIKGLTNGKLYTYHLKAHNAMGGSAPAVITGTPGTKPGPPTINTITPGDQKLTIEFTPPAINGGYSIDNYTLETISGKLKSTHTESSFDINGLTNGKPYTYHLKAHNAMGVSTSAVITGTPATTPGAPDITRITPGNTVITINFTAPINNGGLAVKKYGLEINGSDKPLLKATDFSFVLTALENDESYEFRVKAFNDIGWGALSDSKTGTPVAPIVCNDDKTLNRTYGRLSFDHSRGRGIGGKASLTCDQGYKLMSSTTHVSDPDVAECTSPGTGNRVGIWSDQTATCQTDKNFCGAINSTFGDVNAANGKLEFKSTTVGFGSILMLTCDAGYKLKGTSIPMTSIKAADCFLRQQLPAWAAVDPAPQCIAKTNFCAEVPTTNANGKFSVSRSMGGHAKLECNPGYQLVDKTSGKTVTNTTVSECEVDTTNSNIGRWSEPTSMCKLDPDFCKTTMSKYHNHQDTSYTLTLTNPGKFELGSTMTMTCKAGYQIDESTKSVNAFACALKKGGGRTVKSVDSRRCVPMKCKLKDLPSAARKVHAHKSNASSPNAVDYLKKVELQCDRNYAVSGEINEYPNSHAKIGNISLSAECVLNAGKTRLKWKMSGSCERLSCTKPPIPGNARLVSQSLDTSTNITKGNATLSCATEHHVFSGTSSNEYTLLCLVNDRNTTTKGMIRWTKWSQSINCVPMKCKDLSSFASTVNNAHKPTGSPNAVDYLKKVELQCDRNYAVSG
eukprot:826787_1